MNGCSFIPSLIVLHLPYPVDLAWKIEKLVVFAVRSLFIALVASMINFTFFFFIQKDSFIISGRVKCFIKLHLAEYVNMMY